MMYIESALLSPIKMLDVIVKLGVMSEEHATWPRFFQLREPKYENPNGI